MRFSLKIIYLLAALFLGIAVVACSDDAAEAIPTLEIAHANGEQLSGATINFEQEGGTFEIAIKSNTAWSIGSTVPWITLSEENGSGNGMVTIEVEPTDQPRSAVVVIQVLSSNALRHTFNVVQTASQTDAPDEPSDGDDSSDADDSIPMLPEDTPDDGNDGNDGNDDNGDGGFDGTMTPEDPEDPEDGDDGGNSDNNNPDGGDNDEDGNDNSDENPDNGDSSESTDNGGGAENPEGGDDNGNNDNSDSTNPENPDDSGDDTDTPDIPNEAFTLVDNTTLLTTGRYHIGGYRDDGLHLAVEGLTEGHCNTTPYTFSRGELTASGSAEAIEVRLEATDEANGYYIYFVGQGYLSATKAAAGQLRFTEDRKAYWIFSNHPEGGFVVKQSGSIDVKLIISPYAKINALLRSIAGDEDGNPVMLWRINR